MVIIIIRSTPLTRGVILSNKVVKTVDVLSGNKAPWTLGCGYTYGGVVTYCWHIWGINVHEPAIARYLFLRLPGFWLIARSSKYTPSIRPAFTRPKSIHHPTNIHGEDSPTPLQFGNQPIHEYMIKIGRLRFACEFSGRRWSVNSA